MKEQLRNIKDKRLQIHSLSTCDIEWLIEQAERVEKLEKQNVLFLTALENIVNIDGHFQDVPFDTEKALKMIDDITLKTLERDNL